MGLISYYALAIVVYIAFIIYNLIFYITYRPDICPVITPTAARFLFYESDRFLQSTTVNNTANNTTNTTTTNTTTTNTTATNTTDTNTTDTNTTNTTTTDTNCAAQAAVNDTACTEVNTLSGLSNNPLALMALIIVFIYLIIVVMILLAMLGIYYFSKMSSERFGNLGWCWACLGCYVRNFAALTRLSSFCGLLLIGILAILTITKTSCKLAVHQTVTETSFYTDVGAIYNAAIQVALIDLVFWAFTHCLLPTLKFFIDTEAFLYEPYDRSMSTVYYICCQVLGP